MMSSLLSLLRASSFPVWLLSFYIFIWYLQIGNRWGLLGTVRIEFLVGALLVVISFSHYTRERSKINSHHQSLIKCIGFFYALLILYTIFSYHPTHSRTVFIDRVFKFSMFTLFIGLLVKEESEIKLDLIGYLAAMLKITQEGIVGGIGGGLVWENQGIPRLHGVTPLFAHPNSLSGLAVSALPFFIFLYKFQKGVMRAVFLSGVLGLLYIVLTTGSRTGYVATLVLFLFLLLRLGIFRVRTIFLGLMLTVVVVAVVPESYKERFGTMFKEKEQMDGSANARMEILEDAWTIFIKHPMGVGVQAFPYVRQLEFGRTQDTHNLYLEILTNLGPVGLIAFISVIVCILRINMRSRKMFIKDQRHFLAELCYIINLYVICRLVLGCFGMDLYEVYWWFAAGFTIALAKISIDPQSNNLNLS